MAHAVRQPERPRSEGGTAPPGTEGSTARPRTEGSTGGRHVWVLDPAGQADPMPGLLTEWRRTPSDGGWSGLVAFVADIGTGTPVLVQTWVDADRLRPLPDSAPASRRPPADR